MPTAHAQEEFFSFMKEYTGFLAKMCADEKGKMSALSSRVLSDIEHSIAISQANTKQLANYEEKRIALQQNAGYGGMSFRQLIDTAPPPQRESLKRQLAVFERYVADIRFYNEKSMAIARDNMVDIDPEAVLTGPTGNNPYEKLRNKPDDGGLLETKI